ncbi:GSCFA domain-containing protein [Arthrobacter sp. AK01]|uniref:GSCFA domain-containing protein n=1 Tax=Arthrobacter sp. AK01 TaxID=2894084 RepID=UPI001E6118C9|nr:GSCFA domain-containing protein [Arthrobacter sp. AK01]MCD4852199.1 GSCFA domain-containing protein [Arthrobacter sp. AK01]
MSGLYEKKFDIGPDDAVATAGSCFAQHIATNLRSNGFNVVDAEPAPGSMTPQTRERFGFGVYSARFGNIYYVRQLLQLVQEAYGERQPSNWIWKKGDKYFDALRPSVEPVGLDSESEVIVHREQHLAAVRKLLGTASVLVYTFGLTEGWVDHNSGTVFPTAPGTLCGDFDPDVFSFKNFSYSEVVADFEELRGLIQRHNPHIKFLLTVSPVALAATATDDHVLVSTTYSKSVLRAAVGDLAKKYEDVAYFPSFEIITGSPARGRHWDDTLRSVTPEGVREVMTHFFSSHPAIGGAETENIVTAEELLCEEALLEVFGK